MVLASSLVIIIVDEEDGDHPLQPPPQRVVPVRLDIFPAVSVFVRTKFSPVGRGFGNSIQFHTPLELTVVVQVIPVCVTICIVVPTSHVPCMFGERVLVIETIGGTLSILS